MAQAEVKPESFTWIIKETKELFECLISLRSSEISSKISSSEFITSGTPRSSHEVKWRLQITTKLEPDLGGQSQDKETVKDKKYLALFLRNINYVKQRLSILKVTFFIRDPFKGNVFCKSQTLLEIVSGQHYGFWNFISIEDFKEFKLETLIIFCEFEEIKKDVKRYDTFLYSKTFSDLELQLGDKIYPAHKMILALSSLAFREKFACPESISFLKIEDLEPKVFDELMNYIYTGKVNKKTEMGPELFTAATNYEIWGLMIICKKYLISNLKVENVLPTLITCKKNELCGRSMNDLIDHCTILINNNFKLIMSQELWKTLVKTEPEFLADVLIDLCFDLLTSKCKRKNNSYPKKNIVENCCLHYETFLNNETLSDIEIHVDYKKFPAHKLVLSARSPVFNRMFSHNMKETISKVVEIEDIESEVFYEVLRFMYTNVIESNRYREILIAADKYEINDLKFICAFHLGEELKEENILSTFLFADDYNVQELIETCVNYIIDNFCFVKHVSYLNSSIANFCTELLKKSRAHLILEVLKELASIRCELVL